MQVELDTATLNFTDQPIAELIGPPGGTHEPGAGEPATFPQGGPAGQEPIVIGPVALELTPIAKGKHRITARRVDGGDIVAVDTVDLGRAAQRKRLHRANLREAGALRTRRRGPEPIARPATTGDLRRANGSPANRG